MADYTPEFFEDDDGSEPVLDWLRKLPGYKRRAATAAIEHILARQGAGVCRLAGQMGARRRRHLRAAHPTGLRDRPAQ
jgi:hypothetical protein